MALMNTHNREEIERLLRGATSIQLDFVAARVQTQYDKDAAANIGIHRTTPPSWENKPQLDRAIELLKREAAWAALFGLEHLAIEAVTVLGDAMRGRDRRLRVQAAKEVLSHVVPEKFEIQHKGPIQVEYVNDWRQSSSPESAHWPDNGKATSQEVQLVERGASLAKNDNGNVDRG